MGYEQKRNENEMVLKEIGLVDEEDTIYKLVGPILVKTELDEAKMNLEKRVGFIKDEIKKSEKKLNENESKIVQKNKNAQDLYTKIITISRQVQQQQANQK